MYMIDEIQLEAKKHAFLHSLPLDEFGKNGIVLTEEVISKHSDYLIDVLNYCEMECPAVLESKDDRRYYIIEQENFQDAIAKVLLLDPNTDESVLQANVKNPDIAGLLKRVSKRSYYSERREHLLTSAEGLTDEERKRVIEKLDTSNSMLDRYTLSETDPELDQLLDKMVDDSERPDDYRYRFLRNGKCFNTVFTKEQKEEIFARLSPYVTAETIDRLVKGRDMFFAEYELRDEIKKYQKWATSTK